MKTRLLTTLIAALLALSAWANGTEIDGIYYVLDSSTKTASVTYTGTDYNRNPNSTAYQGNITIPASVTNPADGTTYSVTSIGSGAFRGCEGLTSITIPNSVTSIESSAFFYCSGLTSINIPNSVTSIGSSAFDGCTGLTSITIPNSVTTIGSGAFSDCTSLTSIKVEAGNTKYDSRDNCNAIIETASNTLVVGCKATIIPSSVTSIGDSAFVGCTSLTSITIPNSVTTIGSSAFSNCTRLTSITIPNSVTTIGDYAFIRCIALTSITIPSSVTSIGYRAFNDCTGLTSIKVEAGNTKYDSRDNCNAIIETASNTLVFGCKATTIPSSVTSIGNEAFQACTGLTSITIPNSVTTIDSSAFFWCIGLTSINIPSSVTSIGDWAFSGCTALTSITIPNSVTSIGADAFKGCTGLEDIYALRTDPEAYNCNNSAFEDVPTSTCTLHVPSGSKEAYKAIEPWSNFANIVEDIDTGSDDAVVLTADGEDVWTDGVLRFSVSSEENGEAAVSGVKDKDNLGAVTIPEKVKIADKVYSVTSIGYFAFWGCTGLTSVTIGNSVTTIGDHAFQSCTSLTSITIPNSVTSIGNYAFYRCTGLTSINIPESVTSIGELAFYGCTGLTSVTIGNSVTTIGSAAFEGCTGLTSIKVEAGNTKYDSRDNCNAIIETASNTLVAGCKATTIPSSVTSIGDQAFRGCTSLTSITIPNSVTSIGWAAFNDCTGLTSITIPNSVTTIGSGALAGCTGLTSIKVEAGNTKYDSRDNCNAIIETASNTLVVGCKATIIPCSITSIGNYAFNGCTSLTSITIPNSVTSIGEHAFIGCTGLTSITIPNSVTSIGSSAFNGCHGLEDIYALRTDPAAYNCATDAFRNVPTSTCTLHVPAGCKEAYKAIEPWSNFANIVEEEDLTTIQPPTLAPSEAGETYYTLQGQRIAEPQRGQLVVVRRADGSSRKMYVR